MQQLTVAVYSRNSIGIERGEEGGYRLAMRAAHVEGVLAVAAIPAAQYIPGDVPGGFNPLAAREEPAFSSPAWPKASIWTNRRPWVRCAAPGLARF